jgi:hypothetical protein
MEEGSKGKQCLPASGQCPSCHLVVGFNEYSACIQQSEGHTLNCPQFYLQMM